MGALGLGLGGLALRRRRLVVPFAPSQLPGLTFDADPSLLALSNGATITSLANAIGGSLALNTSSTGVKPTFDSAHLVNGRPAILLSATGPSELYTTGVAAPGSAALEMYLVVQALSASGTTNLLLAGASPLSQAGGVASNVQIGQRGGLWFLGSYDGTNLNVVNGTVDETLHLVHVAVGGGFILGRVDGVVLGNASYPSGGPALPLSIGLSGSGFGFWGWNDPSFGIGPARAYRALGFLGQSANLSAANRMALEAYCASTYGIGSADLVACVGTSITAGSPAPANSYATYLTAQAGMSAWSVWSDGIPGAWASKILSMIEASTSAAVTAAGFSTGGMLNLPSGARAKNVAVLDTESLNEQGQGIGQSTTLANIASGVAQLRAAGYKVVTKTSLPWLANTPIAGFSQTLCDSLNLSIRGGVPGIYGDALADVASASVCPAMQLAPGAVDYDGVNRQTSGQSNPGHPTATGAAAIAAAMAPAILSL